MHEVAVSEKRARALPDPKEGQAVTFMTYLRVVMILLVK
jgi:hypothetical protein